MFDNFASSYPTNLIYLVLEVNNVEIVGLSEVARVNGFTFRNIEHADGEVHFKTAVDFERFPIVTHARVVSAANADNNKKQEPWQEHYIHFHSLW